MRTTEHTERPRRVTSAVTALVTALPLGITAAMLAAAPAAQAEAVPRQWVTVVNNGVNPPGASIHFNSYSQPSVNSAGKVVFRGRTQGSEGGGGGGGETGGVTPLAPDAGGSGAVRGVYSRDMGTAGSPVVTVAQTGGLVPQPNNSDGHFNEFPSFPRIGVDGPAVVTRGQSTPVWTYTLPDGTDTKVGTSGVYATVGGQLTTAASLLGAVPGYEYYAVPGAPAGTRFDQFPASPTIDGQKVAFKGNYAGPDGELTGDYYIDLGQAGSPTQLIADSSTLIPGGGGATFGSTAPPSAANGRLVFTGWDNEDTPTVGGVYLADLAPSPALQTLASIGEQVPGEASGQTFRNFGEGLSFDGRFAAFWGTWGSETYTAHLTCSADGQADLVAYCLTQYPNGYDVAIPAHQGIFVYDTSTGRMFPVAKTGTQFSDFTYWVFSGAPPGVGGSTDPTREPPRWRSSAFAAVSGLTGGAFQTAFKATTTDGTVGIHLSQDEGTDPTAVPPATTLVDLKTPGQTIDPQAPAGSVVSAVGLERDGFRGRNLALSISMLNATTSESWAGIYLTKVEAESTTAQTITFDSPPPASPVVGSSYTVTATASSGLPVVLSIDPASTSGACTLEGTTVHLLKPGTCIIDADQPGNGTWPPAPRVQQVIQIAKAATTVTVALTATTIKATVAPVPPATGTPTGKVNFTRNGTYIGTAPLSAGVATFRYAVKPWMKIGAKYLGDSMFSPSSATATRTHPTITATVTSAHPKTGYGWYRSPVTVTFTCTTNGAPLTAPCPAPVVLSKNAANQSVTRTITATDGGTATVSVQHINIDQVPPTVRITGVLLNPPAPRCIASDALSGVAKCVISHRTVGTRTTYTATATDKAGNVATASASRTTRSPVALGAPIADGTFLSRVS